jgi:hypothetical protein
MIRWEPVIEPPTRELIDLAESCPELVYIPRLLKVWTMFPGKVLYLPAAIAELEFLRRLGQGTDQKATVARALVIYVGSRLTTTPITNPCGITEPVGEVSDQTNGDQG